MSETWPTNARLREDLTTARQAIVELDDALAALRAEHAAFRQHAAANLASLNELAAELTAEVAKDPEFTKMTVGVLRALTWNLGFQFRGEPVPGDWDPGAFYARLAGETEADKPKLRKLEECWGGPDEPETEADKPAPASRKRQLGPLDILDAFRTVTGWSDAEVLHYESECGECDPFASVACDANPAVVAAREADPS